MDNPSSDWRGGRGYISKDMALKGLPGPNDDTLVLVSNFRTSIVSLNFVMSSVSQFMLPMLETDSTLVPTLP